MGKNNWTKEEEAILRENYPYMSLQEIKSLLPGRNTSAIRRKAGKLHVYRYNSRAWSDEELDILIKNYSRMKVKHIMELLPGRSANDIYNKAQSLCLSAYNNHCIDDVLKEMFGKISLSKIACNLGINYSTLRYRVVKIGLL